MRGKLCSKLLWSTGFKSRVRNGADFKTRVRHESRIESLNELADLLNQPPSSVSPSDRRAALQVEHEYRRFLGDAAPEEVTPEMWDQLASVETESERRNLWSFFSSRETLRRETDYKRLLHDQHVQRQRRETAAEVLGGTEEKFKGRLHDETGRSIAGPIMSRLFSRVDEKIVKDRHLARYQFALQFGQPLVFDFGLPCDVEAQEASVIAKQLKLIYKYNVVQWEPYNLYLCNLKSKSEVSKHLTHNFETGTNQDTRLNQLDQSRHVNHLNRLNQLHLDKPLSALDQSHLGNRLNQSDQSRHENPVSHQNRHSNRRENKFNRDSNSSPLAASESQDDESEIATHRLWHLTESCFTDVFPREKIVYLSPYARGVLKDYSQDDVYVISAFGDRFKRDVCLGLPKAKEMRLRTAKLDVDAFFRKRKRANFLISDVVMALIDARDTGGNWPFALRRLPSAHGRRVEWLSRGVEALAHSRADGQVCEEWRTSKEIRSSSETDTWDSHEQKWSKADLLFHNHRAIFKPKRGTNAKQMNNAIKGERRTEKLGPEQS